MYVTLLSVIVNNKWKIFWFATGSIIFLCIPIISSPDFGTGQNLFTIPMFLRMFSSYVGILFFFYLNYFYFIPQLYFRKRYILFVVALIMMFLILDNLPTMIFAEWDGFFKKVKPVGGPSYHPHDKNIPHGNNRKPIWLPENIFFQFFLIVFISLLLRVSMRLKETETEKLKSEVAYLKAQINPHFLFNVLNSIYALTISKSDEAPDAVLRISSLMRYLTSDSSKDLVLVNDELNYIKDYVALQKLRMTANTHLIFRADKDFSHQLQIAPLILISFIENAFKYGVHPDMLSEIQIVITISSNVLILKVYNTKAVEPDDEEKNGIGIHNTQKRLNLLYPDEHKLTISENYNSYFVELTLNLNVKSHSH